MSLKIQIASLAALERLIGGDSTIEIEIRNSIVQNFANKHLKALAGEALDARCVELKKNLAGEAEKVLISQFGRLEENGRHYKPTLVINEETRTALANAASSAAGEVRTEFIALVGRTITNMMMTRFSEERIERMIDERFKHGVEEIVREKVEERLKALKDAL